MTKLLQAAVAALSMILGAMANPAAAQGLTITGEVLEASDAAGYVYLRLGTKDGELWAAVESAPVSRGAVVTVTDAVMMNNFRSKALNRTFDRIAFGRIGGTAAGTGAGHAPAPGHAGTVQAADTLDVKVAKASGKDARTVGEIFGKRGQLKDKPVAVRGRVVKFTPGIMGKNWIHLRDGTGEAKDGSNDLIVTSAESAQVGSVVVAKGTVRTDVVFGPGYAYKVLVDGASLGK